MLVTYKETIKRDISTGQSMCRVITREQNNYTKDGLMVCYGFLPVIEEGTPIDIDGSYDNIKKIYMINNAL